MDSVNQVSKVLATHPCKERLADYRQNLRRTSDKRVFDERVRDLLIAFSNEKEDLVREVNAYADSIGYAQSYFVPSQLEEQLNNFASTKRTKSFRWSTPFKRAESRTAKLFESMSLQVLRFNDGDEIVEALSTLKTHAGFEYLLTGKRYKRDYTADELFEAYLKGIEQIKKHGRIVEPIMIGARRQASGAYEDGVPTGKFKKKTRLISMISLSQLFTELMFARQLQIALGAENVEVYAGGLSDKQITRYMSAWNANHGYWASIDYSKFDQSIPAWLIRAAFDCMKPAFVDMTELEDQIWTGVVESFIVKEFLGPNGSVFARHGVPSGSMFTQIVDTVCNMLMVYTFIYATEENPDLFIDHHMKMMIMGDDNIIFTRFKPMDLERLARYLSGTFGIEVNASKSSRGTRRERPEFLSRVWYPSGAWKELHELILKLLYPENFRPYDEQDVKPEQILYGYLLSFPLAMRQLINVPLFLETFNFQEDDFGAVVKYLPGSIKYVHTYLGAARSPIQVDRAISSIQRQR